MKPAGRKAQSLPTTTLILIILSLVVLVLLILYFTGGMQSLFNAIKGKSGIYTGSTAEAVGLCETMCTTGNKEVCSRTFTFTEGQAAKTCSDLGVPCTSVCSAA